MSVTIDLAPELEAALSAEAVAGGMLLSEYIGQLVRGARTTTGPLPPLSGIEKARLWRQSAAVLPLTEPLSDEAISRESIYRDGLQA
jgi:hypothetical protein